MNPKEGSDEAALYTNGRTSNEAAFIHQLFERELGSHNLLACSSVSGELCGIDYFQAGGAWSRPSASARPPRVLSRTTLGDTVPAA